MAGDAAGRATYIARRPAAVAARHAAWSKWLLPAPSAPQSHTVSASPLARLPDVLDRGSVAARDERLEARMILEHERER